MSPVTERVANSVRRAATEVSSGVTALEVVIVQLELRAAAAERGREEALQESGRRWVRVEQLETFLGRLVDDGRLIAVDQDTSLYQARVLLGLDGQTGARDVNAEVTP